MGKNEEFDKMIHLNNVLKILDCFSDIICALQLIKMLQCSTATEVWLGRKDEAVPICKKMTLRKNERIKNIRKELKRNEEIKEERKKEDRRNDYM